MPCNIPNKYSKWQPNSIYKPSNIKCIIKLHSYLEEIAVICCFWRTNTNLLKFEAVVGTDWRNWWRWPYTWALDSARKSSLIRVTIPHGHIPQELLCANSNINMYVHKTYVGLILECVPEMRWWRRTPRSFSVLHVNCCWSSTSSKAL